ncbi:MAG: DUF2312 domain-containing protein [Alphaproteobacteria bacterium]|nr:MAG: DUF2312 domain-containing protein [Alphaproteobacteria bacterium]
MTTVAIDKLKAIIERVETLEEQKTEVASQVKEILDGARADGFDIPTIKKVMRLRKMKREDLQTQDALLQLYRDAVGV